MSHERLSVRTHDGDCPVHLFTPDNNTGPWPAVILYMDGLAIRPALFDMARRMADGGYVVLLPDLFYRVGPYEPLDPVKVFAGGNIREALGHLFASTDNHRAAEDTKAFIALTVAGTYPQRVAAAASFHGGNLATDAETSPHYLAPKMKGRIYVAGADNDAHYPPEMNDRLDAALTEAGIDHRCEIYEGALHGWTMTDFPVYNPEAAERHWRELFALFNATLQ